MKFLVIAWVCVCLVSRVHAQTWPILVDISSSSVSDSTLLAVRAAAGLWNRASANVYTLQTADDSEWLSLLLPSAHIRNETISNFLHLSFAQFGAIFYGSLDANVAFLPTIVTLSGAMNCIPLSDDLFHQYPKTLIIFNASTRWATPEAAVQDAVTLALSKTTSLAFQDGMLLKKGLLVDWLVKERIFTQYLNKSCIPGSGDHAILVDMIERSPWSRPVRVYGYNSADVIFGGDLFEAETNCMNWMGQVATAHSNNLAFWSTIAPFVDGVPQGQPGGPMVQAPSPRVPYDPTRSYVALVYGDMDNIDFVQSFGRQHMQFRADSCAKAPTPCFPLTWTLSPNLIKFSPAMLRWYYTQAARTGGRDWFIMPPSGTLYAYPGEMPSDVQAAYASQQNAQAVIMNTTGAVHWEWILSWRAAWTHYFPRYVNATGTRAFFLNNVPWVVPIPDMIFANQTYRVVGAGPGAVVGFKPAFNWQEGGASGGLPYNSTVIAHRINAFRLGSVQYVYVIQNTNITSLFSMVNQLAPHVQLVGYQQLAQLALDAADAGFANSVDDDAHK